MIDLRLGNCLEVMKTFPDNTVDAIVTDPPYGLSFMGKKWDYDVPSQEIWEEALRVLKPGGYLLSFAGTRTQHRMAVRIEDAGFEIRDMIAWVYGSGFPKSLNIGKAVDKLQGNKREVTGREDVGHDITNNAYKDAKPERKIMDITKGISEWEGWGTALKPALEPITVARKPLSEKNVAENVLKWGVGGIDIDGCRVGTDGGGTNCNNRDENGKCLGHKNAGRSTSGETIHADLQGNDLLDIIKICQLNHLNLPVNDAELKRFQDDTTNAIKMLCSALVSADTLTLEKTLGRLQEDITIMDMLCCEGMLVENMNTSLNIFTSGKKSSDLYLKVAKYTILTAKKMITDWKISNSLVSQLTESLLTQVKNLENTSDVQGRFPSNLIHDGSDEVVGLFPNTKSGKLKSDSYIKDRDNDSIFAGGGLYEHKGYEADSGSAARFFYCAKASKSERQGSTHPTMKPIRLMEYLVKLVSREGAVVLDPFMGSGTTGIACRNLKRNFIGIEMSEEYLKIAEARINSVHQETML